MSIQEVISKSLPGAQVEEIRELGADVSADATVLKSIGYGKPLLLKIRDAAGRAQALVLHTARADVFGHDRRADRAAELLLAFDTFGTIPRHTRALDVGAINKDGSSLISLRDAGEFYLLTNYVQGQPYAEDLRRIALRRSLEAQDRERCRTLASYLARLHTEALSDGPSYTRAIRDLLGSGEGIFGIIDGFPSNSPDALLARLKAIEKRCLDFRWRLKNRPLRLRRTHGDFHPFNLLFDQQAELHVLDASRGCRGDPADDVSCLAINYIFFALDQPGAWQGGLRELFYSFFETYGQERSDPELLEAMPPFLAWRALVLTNPVWYAGLSDDSRDRLLSLVEHSLDLGRFELKRADTVFAA